MERIMVTTKYSHSHFDTTDRLSPILKSKNVVLKKVCANRSAVLSLEHVCLVCSKHAYRRESSWKKYSSNGSSVSRSRPRRRYSCPCLMHGYILELGVVFHTQSILSLRDQVEDLDTPQRLI